MSDDFFKSFEAVHGTATNNGMTATGNSGTSNRRKAPPPPPPGGRSTVPSSSYYSSSGNSSGAPAAAPSRRGMPPGNSTSNATTTSMPAATTSRTSRPVVQSRRPAPHPPGQSPSNNSYYSSNPNTVPANPPRGLSASSSAAAAPSSFHSASNPYATSRVAPPQQQQQSYYTTQSATAETEDDSWFEDDTTTMTTSTNTAPGQFQSSSMSFGQSAPRQFQQQPQKSQQQAYFGNQQKTGYSFGQQQQQPNHDQFGQESDDNGLQGTMDSGAAAAPNKPTVFVPNMTSSSNNNRNNYADDDFENEPPLLEELGINPGHIFLKVKAVVLPSQRIWGKSSALMDPSLIVDDADLAGPVVFGLALGGELLLTGKIHFGYIYGFFLFGCMAMTLLINLLSPQQAVSFWTVTSILGYSLLPVNVLAAVKIVVINLAHLSTLGQVLGIATVLWSTAASTRLLEVGCQLRDQRYLLAYPLAMLYSAFVLITIF